jgi:MFS family permease
MSTKSDDEAQPERERATTASVLEVTNDPNYQVFFAALAYATQKSVSLILMDFVPLAEIAVGGDRGLSIMIIGFYQTGISCSSFFSAKIFRKIGRRGGYIVSTSLFAFGAVLGTLGLVIRSPIALTISVLFTGFAIGIAGTVRFAALEICAPDKRSKDKALTAVMSGGILSAAFGPLTVPLVADIIPKTPFLGCYLVIFVLIALNAWLVGFMINFPPAPVQKKDKNTGELKNDNAYDAPNKATMLALFFPNRENLLKFVLATGSSACSNLYLMLVMSSVLTEMTINKGFSLMDTSVAVFACFMGRFIMGPWSGAFMKDHGIYIGQFTSCACFLLSNLIFFVGDSIGAFIVGMALAGLGWHFGFSGGNILLSRVKSQRDKRKMQYQALHDFSVFFGTGLVVMITSIPAPSWHTVMFVALVVALILVGVTVASYNMGFTTKEVDDVAARRASSKAEVAAANMELELGLASSAATGPARAVVEDGGGGVATTVNPMMIAANTGSSEYKETAAESGGGGSARDAPPTRQERTLSGTL